MSQTRMSQPRNLLQLIDGHKAFGARDIFTDASFAVNEGEKLGVIGPNGAGKSTLFRILIGEESLSSGEITKAAGLRIGYLAQDDHWQPGQTVEDYLGSQAQTPIWDLKAFAPRFGLRVEDFAKPVMSLSGGYRMRVKLLYLLASKPDLMLLDEPTNYLDLETLVVLENFLQETTGAFMLISHDREFLRRTTDHILEIEGGEMTKYAGNIDDYFEQKALLREQMERSAASAQAKRKEVLDFAARFGAKATKARQVQSRLKLLEKMETIEVRALPVRAKIRLPEPARTGREVLKALECNLGYGERIVLGGLDISLERGDHLGVVGVNGAGKSTLLKSLAGELAPLSGSIERGLGATVAYFAQHVAERLDPRATVLEAMSAEAHPETRRQEILDLAGSLLFGGDDVHKKIGVLSGGEKSRVALGRMLLKRATCLLLDEPTNHLDFDTVEALTQALHEYPGSVVIVSHDRGFVRRTASKILEIRDGRASVYPGTYDEYVWSFQNGVLGEARAGAQAGASPRSGSPGEVAMPQSVEPKFNFKEWKKNLERELRALEKEMQQIEDRSESARARILSLNHELCTVSGAVAAEKAREIASAQAVIEADDERYLQCIERIDSIRSELSSFDNDKS